MNIIKCPSNCPCSALFVSVNQTVLQFTPPEDVSTTKRSISVDHTLEWMSQLLTWASSINIYSGSVNRSSTELETMWISLLWHLCLFSHFLLRTHVGSIGRTWVGLHPFTSSLSCLALGGFFFSRTKWIEVIHLHIHICVKRTNGYACLPDLSSML